MDWDDTLRQLNPAVTVVEAVSRWQGDDSAICHVTTGVNATYRFTAGGTKNYLRLTHTSLISEQKVRSALNYLAHLQRSRAQVCKPVSSQNGFLVETLPVHQETERLPDGGDWMATVTQAVEGRPIGMDTNDLAVYEEWGRCLGTIHKAARSYTPAPQDTFEDAAARQVKWQQYKKDLSAFDVLALREYEYLASWLRQLPSVEGHPDYGLIHGDTNPRNFIWTGQRVTAIDFDEPAWHWFAMDIARALVELMWRDQRHEFRACFIRGYRSVCDFSSFWEDNLTRFMRLFALGNYIEAAPYATPEALAEADKAGPNRPGDFCWCLRKRFADPRLWDD